MMTLPAIRRLDHVVRRQVVGTQPIGIDVDDDGADVGAERRGADGAGDIGLEQRPNALLGQVGQRAQRFALAGQHQVADRHAAGVHAHDLRRQHARRHARLRPVGLGDDLGHRLRHVRAGVERQLDQGDLLNALRLDVLDAIDVLEVQLELVDDQPFHLGGAHAVEILDDVDLRQIERREDVDAHAVHGQSAAADQGDHHHHHGDGVAHRELDGVHGLSVCRYRILPGL